MNNYENFQDDINNKCISVPPWCCCLCCLCCFSKEKNNIIFLDVDGVLNSIKTKERFEGVIGLDNDLVNKLSLIIKKTNALVVISSTWRLSDLRKRKLINTLNEYNIKVIGSTIDFSITGEEDRVDEIFNWLENNKDIKIKNWIAIDDYNLTQINSKISNSNFVKTIYDVGLTNKNVIEAISKLNK